MRILLAIDGSEHSEAVIDEVDRQHFPADSEIRVISVIEPLHFPYLSLNLVSLSFYEETENNIRAMVEKAAAKLRVDKKNQQLKVTTKILSGLPKEVILEEAEAFGADLIVMGSHGYGSLERFLLGSVSQAVVLHAKCSVEIVRCPKTQTSKSQ